MALTYKQTKDRFKEQLRELRENAVERLLSEMEIGVKYDRDELNNLIGNFFTPEMMSYVCGNERRMIKTTKDYHLKYKLVSIDGIPVNDDDYLDVYKERVAYTKKA